MLHLAHILRSTSFWFNPLFTVQLTALIPFFFKSFITLLVIYLSSLLSSRRSDSPHAIFPDGLWPPCTVTFLIFFISAFLLSLICINPVTYRVLSHKINICQNHFYVHLLIIYHFAWMLYKQSCYNSMILSKQQSRLQISSGGRILYS